MRKAGKYILIIALMMTVAGVFADKQTLQKNLVRLHVVANSDSEEDQTVKLQVRDAITAYLQPAMEKLTSKTEAVSYLQTQLSELEAIANRVLETAGSKNRAVVTLARESFDTRFYDTFKLPAGVYDSLRVKIGTGEGHNWWCVVFPTLCLPATGEAFHDTAVSSGFDDVLTDTLSGKQDYEIRFFLMDCMGRIENFFYKK